MRRLAYAIGLFLLFTGRVVAQTELLMFEQPGCVYCLQWHADIGTEYPLTEEGQAAPLRSLQLRDPVPEDLTLVSHPVFTPTFVLVRNGTEIGRIEGYPGEDFFWGLLASLLSESRTAAEVN